MTWARWPFAAVVAVGMLAAIWFGVREAFWPGEEAEGPPRSARAGDILLVNSYAEEPRGDWAAPGADLRVYAWLFNDGQRPDELLSVSSPIAGSVAVNGSSLPAELPPQEWLSFGPTGSYLVLDGLTRPVRAGRTLPITFVFAEAGTLRVDVVALEHESAVTPSPSPTATAAGTENEKG